jgi:hypothetical protein
MSERVQAAIEARERASRGEPEPRKRGTQRELQGQEGTAVSEGREAEEAVSEEVDGAEGN